MDIKSEILDYINCRETTGALLVTGPWGCGKSYLVKQIAKELNQEKKAAVAVISLFGLDSIPAINKRVKEEYTSFKLGTLGRSARKITKGLGTLAKDGLAIASVASPEVTGLSAASQGLSAALSYDLFGFIEVQNKIGNGNNERKFVIVFDDLERCGIGNKQDLLGAINDFVENKQIKVIVIADEAKIDNEEYKEYKEKLISRTLRMTADYDRLVEEIVNGYNECVLGYKQFLISNTDLIQQLFAESKSSNLRTLKCIFADFERVYEAWIETEISRDYIKWCLYTFGVEMFTSKIPKKEDPKNADELFYSSMEKEQQYLHKGKYYSNFYSLQHWVDYGIWDKNIFIEELTGKYVPKSEAPKYRFLNYRFWDLEQNDIDEGLPQAIQFAYDGDLTKDELISLIDKIHAMHVYKITVPVEVNYKQIEEGFDQRFRKIVEGTITEPRNHTFTEKSSIDKEAYGLLAKINSFEDRLAAAENRATFIRYLSGDDSVTYYSLRGMYIEEFDDELLGIFIKQYSEANNSYKTEYARALLKMTFDFDTYSTEENQEHTKQNFLKLAEYLEKEKPEDQITEIIHKSFTEDIRKKYSAK